MNKTTQTLSDTHTCYHLLQKVLLDAFQAETLFFTYPYENLSKIDGGIRSLMWSKSDDMDKLFIPLTHDFGSRLVVVRSNLGFYNILAYLDASATSDFISIGPFRAEEFSSEYFAKLIRDLRLPTTTQLLLKHFYEGLPFVPLAAIINVTRDVLAMYAPEFEEMLPAYVGYSEETRELQLNLDMLLEYSTDFGEMYQKGLFRFLDIIKSGDIRASKQELNHFFKETKFTFHQNVTECKRDLYTLNDFCQMALLQTSVHPSHTLKIWATINFNISNTNDSDVLLEMPYDFCQQYGMLVKKYAFSEYSSVVRSVINYIQLHLEENLTLSTLAAHFKKNPTSLSNLFSKEVGMSITNYIHQTRINKAMYYFDMTNMSVSEVALAVGFQDFAYFSRLFRKQTGMSPRDYCRNI